VPAVSFNLIVVHGHGKFLGLASSDRPADVGPVRTVI
jgi:hypothetical protein